MSVACNAIQCHCESDIAEIKIHQHLSFVKLFLASHEERSTYVRWGGTVRTKQGHYQSPACEPESTGFPEVACRTVSEGSLTEVEMAQKQLCHWKSTHHGEKHWKLETTISLHSSQAALQVRECHFLAAQFAGDPSRQLDLFDWARLPRVLAVHENVNLKKPNGFI